jgi:ABC-2 type transport system permease protein
VFIVFGGDEIPITAGNTQTASSFGLTVILVLAVLSAATEYNWSTMRTSFQAVPKRAPALPGKDWSSSSPACSGPVSGCSRAAPPSR